MNEDIERILSSIKPKKSCRQCQGRGFVGYNKVLKRNEDCSCIKKQYFKLSVKDKLVLQEHLLSSKIQ